MDDSETCKYYVQRKKRYCKMLVKSGKRFCGQHLVEDVSQDPGEMKRIPCPLDPKHSCYEHRLKQHLEVCNAKEVTGLPFISRNINLGTADEEPKKTLLSALSDDQLRSFIKRVEDVHKENVGDIKRAELSNVALLKEMSTPGYGPSVIRHLNQNSSLLGHLSQAGCLDTTTSPTCFIEFGAGRGQLTHWLTESVTDISKSLFVLVDKGAQRYKFDAKLKYNKDLFLKRLRIDIQHLALEGIEDITNYDQIVGFGKHLCGGATDLALHCLSRQNGQKVAVIVVALCCHHRCTWNTYAGQSFLQDAGFSADEFYTLTALTSWATCNSKDIESKNKKEGNIEEDSLGEEVVEEVEQNTSDLKNSRRDEVAEKADQNTLNLMDSIEEKLVKKVEQNTPNLNDSLGDQDVEKVDQNTPNLKDSEDYTGTDNRYTRLGLSAQYREEVGRKAKQILDYGRVKYLNDHGFRSQLVQYVDKNATLENIALIATNDNWTPPKK